MEEALSKTDGSNSRQQQTMDKLYLEKDETGDVTFIVELEKIRAHKSILAAISPKYKAQFYGLHSDQGDIVVEDVTASAFKEFLQLFYLENPKVTKENIEGVLNLAKQSLAENLFTYCVGILMLQADVVKDACFVYRLALLYDIEELIEVCRWSISKNTMEVFKSDGFLVNCDRYMLLDFLKMDSLKCKETDIFEAAISWAKAACKEKNLDAEKMENLRLELGDAFYEIRFLSMTITEFVHLHSLHEGLFTQHEMQEIIYIIGNLKDFQASKFNQTLRNEELQELEVNRVVRGEVTGGLAKIIPVGFKCSKAIRLNGLTAGFELPSNQYCLQLTITSENGFVTEHKPNYTIKHLTVDEPPPTLVTSVTFEEPIDIQLNNRVVVSFLDIPPIKYFTEYTLSKKVELENYKFCFNVFDVNETENVPGMLLTRLSFTKIK